MAKKSLEQEMSDNPDDWFPAEEAERRMKEIMRRGSGQGATFDLRTGQNLKPPFLSDTELRERGYPCEPWWDKTAAVE